MNIYDFQHQFNLDLPRYGYDASKYLIYLLVKDNKIVYVGKSDFRNVMGRLRSHEKDKDFDSYCLLPFPGNEYQTLSFESGLISLLRPQYNQSGCKVDIMKVKYLLDCMEPVNDPIPEFIDDINSTESTAGNKSAFAQKTTSLGRQVILLIATGLFIAIMFVGILGSLFLLEQLDEYLAGEPMPFEVEILKKYDWQKYYVHYDTCATATNFITQKDNQ